MGTKPIPMPDSVRGHRVPTKWSCDWGHAHPSPMHATRCNIRNRERAQAQELKRRTRWGVFRWTPELGRVPNHELPKLAIGGREFRTERAAEAWIDRSELLQGERGYVVRFWILDPPA